MNVDHLSLTTTPILLFNNGDQVSQGTVFFMMHKYESIEVLFLITNYHVLTGASPKENKKPIGNWIQFQLHKNSSNPSDVKIVNLPLFTKEGKPIWLLNDNEKNADLAIIPISSAFYNDCYVSCISEDYAKTKLKVRPASNISIIGYPYGYYDQTNALPVWKSGSIASEPEVDFQGQPYFLIDVSAFPGMSGAPVFSISYGTYESEGGGTVAGSAKKFLGIYASMQMLNRKMYLEQMSYELQLGINDSVSLELGHVWKANLIIDTLEKLNIENYSSEILAKL